MDMLQDELYKTFLQASGQQTAALSEMTALLSDLLSQGGGTYTVDPPAGAKATVAYSGAQDQSAGDVLSSVASTVLKSGFGLAPLVTGLFSLFGGGAQDGPAPLIKYAMPQAIDFHAAETASGISGVDYDQSGMPRNYRPDAPSVRQTVASTSPAPIGGPDAMQQTQIHVNVQAMDARSFLDRSNDIALAVREAMLNMNALNDVVGEL